MHLPHRLFQQALALLASRELRKLAGRLAGRLPRAREPDHTRLKAALNLAAEHDERINNRRAWETGLATIPDAEQSRNVIYPRRAMRQIIVAAQGQSDEFGLLIEVQPSLARA